MLVRSRPRRPAWLYPTGSKLTLRDGRTFIVCQKWQRVWEDPSMGCGGGYDAWRLSPRYWKES